MRWLVLLALVACDGKQGKSGPGKGARIAFDAIDRSCTADTDCTLTGHLTCCDTACGANSGDAVNAKAWNAVGDQFQPDCKGEECNVMCQKLPDCRDEDVAVCKAGRCEKTMRPSETCTKLGVTPDEYCESPGDCTTAGFRDCCTDCAAPVVTRRVAARLRREADKTCTAEARAKCGEINCPARATTCRENRCVEGE